MDAVLQMGRVRQRRRKRRSGLRSPLAEALARNELPVLLDHSVESYKLQKIVHARENYRAACRRIRFIEWWTSWAKTVWYITNQVAMVGLGVGAFVLLVCLCIAAVTVFTSPMTAALLVAVPGGVTVGSFLLMLGADRSFQPIAGPVRSQLQRQRHAALSRENPELEWATLPYAEYIRLFKVPHRVRELATQLTAQVPTATLVVEYTAAVRWPIVDHEMWSYNPDPFLTISLGTESYRVAVWDEKLKQPPCRYLH